MDLIDPESPFDERGWDGARLLLDLELLAGGKSPLDLLGLNDALVVVIPPTGGEGGYWSSLGLMGMGGSPFPTRPGAGTTLLANLEKNVPEPDMTGDVSSALVRIFLPYSLGPCCYLQSDASELFRPMLAGEESSVESCGLMISMMSAGSQKPVARRHAGKRLVHYKLAADSQDIKSIQ